MQFGEQLKVALTSCVETVLMRKGNTKYNLVIIKLNSHYNCNIKDCYEHPDYLRIILKEVYKEDYNSVLGEIKLLLDDLVNEKEIASFLKIMDD